MRGTIHASKNRYQPSYLDTIKINNRNNKSEKKSKHSARHVSRNMMNYMTSVYNDMGLLLVNVDKLFSFKPRSNIEYLHETMLTQHL